MKKLESLKKEVFQLEENQSNITGGGLWKSIVGSITTKVFKWNEAYLLYDDNDVLLAVHNPTNS